MPHVKLEAIHERIFTQRENLKNPAKFSQVDAMKCRVGGTRLAETHGN